MARRAGSVRCRLSPGRCGAEHLQLSPDAGRLHLRCLRAGARLRGYPAGPGNTEQQFELIEAYRPIGYSGTPDFLKILLDAALSAGRDVSSIKRALVSGAAFPRTLQEEIKSRGVDAYQAFGTADLGLIAFETSAREGMVVNEDLILEIGTPGTGEPVHEGDVGEIVVTSLDPDHPWI